MVGNSPTRKLLDRTQIRNDAGAIVMDGRGSDTRNKNGLPVGKLWKLRAPTASAAGFHLGRETGRNLLREVARHLSWEARGASETGLAAKKMKWQPARGKFFLDNPLS